MPKAQLPPGVPDFETFLKERHAAASLRRKEKKRGGVPLPWWPNFAAVKGAGAGAQLAAVLASKAGILAFFSSVALGILALGAHHRLQLQNNRDRFGHKRFETALLRDHLLRQYSGMGKAVPTVDGVRNDTLGFVKSGDLSDPMSTRPGAAAEAGAAGEGGAAGSEGAQGANGAGTGQDPQAEDPNALAAALAAQAGAQGAAGARGGAGAGGFAKLPGFGGSRGGVSGGGRGLDAAGGKATLGQAQATRGGNEANLMTSKTGKGRPRDWAGRRSVTSAARSSASANRLRQVSADMIANQNAEIGKAAAANTAAWEAAAAPGQSVTGPGAGIPGASDAGGSGVGAWPGEGGPTVVKTEGPAEASYAKLPDIPAFKNVTPYQWAIDIAKALMILATVIAFLIAFAKLLLPTWVGSAQGAAIMTYCMYALAAIGGALAGLGAYIATQGQVVQAAIWCTLGTVLCATGLASAGGASAAWVSVAGLVGAPASLLLEGAAEQSHFLGANDNSAAKEAYRKQWGIDPDTNDVINPKKFDKRFGKGSAESWDTFSDMS